MTLHDRENGARNDGFTLLEVLVASALTVLIAAALLGVSTTMLRNWNRDQGRLRAAGQARRILDQIERDLQDAMCRDSGGVWLAATIQAAGSVNSDWVDGAKPTASSLDPAAQVLTDARFGVAGVWLRFFTTRLGSDPRTGDASAPVAVAYQLVRRSRTSGNSDPSYLFYRSESTSAAAHEAGFDLASANYSAASKENGAVGNLLTPPTRYLLGENVVDFGVRFYSTAVDGAGRRQLVSLFPLSFSDLEYRAKSPDGPAGERMPWVVDVVIRILSDEGARMISELENHRLAGTWWVIALANSYVFTRRIVVTVAAP